MGQRAKKIYLAVGHDEDVAPPPPISLRDFTQPWLDLNDKSVLVTGGTGSFGKHFVKTVIENYKPRRLVIYSRDELKQYEMQQLFPMDQHPFMRYFIGDVRDRDRLELALNNIDYVVHAAALKQVPTAEYNPFECISTNVFGAENLVYAALRRNVRKVIALSTDKAANPVNLYGASKLASDKIFVAANNLAGADGTRLVHQGPAPVTRPEGRAYTAGAESPVNGAAGGRPGSPLQGALHTSPGIHAGAPGVTYPSCRSARRPVRRRRRPCAATR